ncbi:hypothetical protein HN51_056431, partial [Arachis hypogaea]
RSHLPPPFVRVTVLLGPHPRCCLLPPRRSSTTSHSSPSKLIFIAAVVSLCPHSPPPASVSSPCAALAHRASPPVQLRHSALLPLLSLCSSVVRPSSSTPLLSRVAFFLHAAPPASETLMSIWMWLC